MSKLHQFKLKTTNKRVYWEALNKLTAIINSERKLTKEQAVTKLLILYPRYSHMKKDLLAFARLTNSN